MRGANHGPTALKSSVVLREHDQLPLNRLACRMLGVVLRRKRVAVRRDYLVAADRTSIYPRERRTITGAMDGIECRVFVLGNVRIVLIQSHGLSLSLAPVGRGPLDRLCSGHAIPYLGGVTPFEPNAMADCMMAEDKGQLDGRPESTRELLAGCAASLKKHHADGVIAEHRAFEMVRKLRDVGKGSEK